jgi:hypothetical protein
MPKIMNKKWAGHPWLMPAILVPQEAEIRRITVQIQPRQIVQETQSRKETVTKRSINCNKCTSVMEDINIRGSWV